MPKFTHAEVETEKTAVGVTLHLTIEDANRLLGLLGKTFGDDAGDVYQALAAIKTHAGLEHTEPKSTKLSFVDCR